jgi:hypothetical protein
VEEYYPEMIKMSIELIKTIIIFPENGHVRLYDLQAVGMFG